MDRPDFRPAHTKTVIVVDDDALLRNAVRRQLIREGFRVRCYAHPRHFCGEYERGDTEFDLLLTDWEFNDPEWDGLTLIGRLKDPDGSGKPVILWSGNDNVFDAALASQRPPDLVMRKSDQRQVIERIKSLLDR